MTSADDALRECHALVRAQIVHLPVDDATLHGFVERFRGDFERVFDASPDAWALDARKVTTLARSIGSFAEFAALTDVAVPNAVGYAHLRRAYEILGPQCRPEGVMPQRQYCTNAQV
jgi:hypothetical protein